MLQIMNNWGVPEVTGKQKYFHISFSIVSVHSFMIGKSIETKKQHS